MKINNKKIRSKKILWPIFIVVTAIGVYSWLRILESIEPHAVESEDGEGGKATDVDPDVPRAQLGDVLLFNRATGLNRLITWFTKSRYYHVGIALGNGQVIEARPRGVVIRDLVEEEGDKRFEIIPAQNVGGREAGERAAAWAKNQLGEGYDPFNVLTIILDRTFTCCVWNGTLPDRWSCGEFVGMAFQETGTELFPECRIETIVPADYEKFLS